MITRIISGIIGIGIAGYVIQTGGTTFTVAAAVLAALAWFEYTRAFSHRGGNPALFSGMASGECCTARSSGRRV